MKNIELLFLFTLLFYSFTNSYAQTSVKFDKDKFQRNLIGQHGITLQWISWDFRGVVKVTEEDKIFKIKGEQKSKDSKGDYVGIEGTLEAISDRELKFVGKITTKVHYNNGGSPCEKEGVYTFKRTGTRKYFRLQEMQNCDGVVVDYVDLYF
jgi:hypothetical protein